MQGKARIDFANTLRGFAALAVVISHYYGAFWSYREGVEYLTNAPALPIETHAFPAYISWLHAIPIFNWGAYGVALFFIISGFVIPFSLQRMNWIGFTANRLLRIIPTYIIGFSVTLLAILISTEYFSRNWPFSMREVLIHYIPGIRDVMWSRNIDGIVWTLEVEMKFYLVCALLLAWFRQKSLKVFIAPVALFVTALYANQLIPEWNKTSTSAWQLAMTFMIASQYIIYMFIGVIFHYLHCGRLTPIKAYAGIAGLFTLFCTHWWLGPYSASLPVAWSYAFALLCFIFAYRFPNLFRANRIFNFLANISYPLYVIHGVAGYVALRIMLDLGFKAWVSLLVVTAAALSLSWLLHVLVEQPSQVLGKRLGAKLSGVPKQPTAICSQLN
ncbi:acyltransferase family protein [Pseudomonas schmalbachii]|uniref:Acyltransferase n=1 Tax=Pseudomonas schmalbachii TaxID=2816993 RepID=A0ABS3TRC5_9PSED|nr:acyltransferase [Pseudomonas schmalbachii]MBO3276222.1 acyltransferase [Pseudomonas schmalbachii]